MQILDDAVQEADEYFFLTLKAPAGAVLGSRTHMVTIRDDDSVPGISVTPIVISTEGTGTTTQLMFKVRLSARGGQNVSVDYKTRDGTATAGLDYEPKSGTLIFMPDMVEQTVGVTVYGDATPEPDEFLFLDFSNPVNALLFPSSHSAKGIIIDDDARKIAFTSDRDGNREIYVMNEDGSGQIDLSNSPADDSSPTWSPDGTKIAFTSTRDGVSQIYVMNADGTQQTNCTKSAVPVASPAWSPSGNRILFTRYGNTDPADSDLYAMDIADCYVSPSPAPVPLATDHPDREEQAAWSPYGGIIYVHSTPGSDRQLFTMSSDGSGKAPFPLNFLPVNTVEPAWSSDGQRISFTGVWGPAYQVYTVNTDGSHLTQLTPTISNSFSSSFSGDGSKIVFATTRDGNAEIYVMNAVRNAAQVNLTHHSANDTEPAWQPLPPLTPAGQPPLITAHPSSQTVRSGQAVMLAVSASGTGPLQYQWYKGPSGDDSKLILGANASTYWTPQLTSFASYWARVSNVYGSDDSSAALISLGVPPAIVTQPRSRTILPGQRATITVAATGTSPLTYQWYQGQPGVTTAPIAGATASNYTTSALSTTATYWVRVSNQYGPDADSAAATITVGTYSSGKIAFTTRRDGNSEIYSMNPDGSGLTNLSNNPAEDSTPAWSPDGARIAFTSSRPKSAQIFVMNADGTQQKSCTPSTVGAAFPAWSPDGTKILFSQYRRTLIDPPDGIYVMNAAECGFPSPAAMPLVVLGGPDLIGKAAWSPDGASIVYVRTTFSGEERLFVRSVTDNDPSLPGTPLPNIFPINASNPKWSAVGRTIAFTGYVPGNQTQIYVIAADGTGGATPLTTPANYDGVTPVFSPEGNKIAFATIRDGNSEIYVMNADGYAANEHHSSRGG